MPLPRDSFHANDDTSRSATFTPPPPPRQLVERPTNGEWVYFESSRFESWVSTVEGSTTSATSDDNSVESFHDNAIIDVEKAVVITGNGWEVEVQPSTLTTQPNTDRSHVNKSKHRVNKQKHSSDSNHYRNGTCCARTRETPACRIFFIAGIVLLLALLGALGVAHIVSSRQAAAAIEDYAPFDGLTLGNSGPPDSTIDWADIESVDTIDEVGKEDYYNNEDDDDFVDESMDDENVSLGNDLWDSKSDDEMVTVADADKSQETRFPTVSPTEIPKTISPEPTQAPSKSAPTRPAPTELSISSPIVSMPQTRPSVPDVPLSVHNQYLVPDSLATDIDGNILVPERKRNTLFIFNGGKSPEDRAWKAMDALWSLRLYPKHLWVKSNSINDIKRVTHKNRIHIAVCGSGGDAVALYDFVTKSAAYWSKTCGTAPHDVDYIPLKGGFLAVASSRGRFSTIELHDVSATNDQGCIAGSTIGHPGVHSLHWDGKQSLLWAWGSDSRDLIAYRIVFAPSGEPSLVKDQVYEPDVENFVVGTGHGGTPMIVDGRRYLLLAGNSGVLRFDTESHDWSIEYRAPDNTGWYSNPKGISYNMITREVIFAKSNSRVYSGETGQRQIEPSDIYKARWWQHNAFAYNLEDVDVDNESATILSRPVTKPIPKPVDPFFASDFLVGVYYFPRNSILKGQQYLRSQLQPSQPPKLGEYDAGDPTVIGQHLAWSREAKINLWVTGWRGPDSKEDVIIRNAILPHQDLKGTKIALLYETHTRIDLKGESSLDQVYEDLKFIADMYFSDPNYLRIDERPVIYLYLSRVLHHNLILEQVVYLMRQAALDNGGHNIYIVGDQSFGMAPVPGALYSPFDLLDSVTSYDVYGDIAKGGYAEKEGVDEYKNKQQRWKDATVAHGACGFIPSVTPGFNDGPRHSPLSRKVHAFADYGSLFRRLLDNALIIADSSQNQKMVMITSWNGFHDDTQIEPVQEAPATQLAIGSYNQMQLDYEGYGTLYLKIVKQTIARHKIV